MKDSFLLKAHNKDECAVFFTILAAPHPGAILLPHGPYITSHMWAPAACELPTISRVEWTKCEQEAVADASAGQKTITYEALIKTMSWMISSVGVENR